MKKIIAFIIGSMALSFCLSCSKVPPVNNIPVTGIRIDPVDLTLTVGQSQSLSAVISPSDATDKTVAWRSDNPDVAAVDENGTVVGRKIGKATITATSVSGGLSANCSVQVAGPKDYLAFDIRDEGTIGMENRSDLIITVEYSIDDGRNWEVKTISKEESFRINVSKGMTVLFRGNNPRYATGLNINDYCRFTLNTPASVRGNILSLVNKDFNIDPVPVIEDYAFVCLFSNIALNSAKGLILPEIVSLGCYGNMFNGCTSLIEAPELPARELAPQCYEGMISGCYSMITAPDLPAETMAKECYRSMFSNCSKLTNAPTLPASSLAEGCYMGMFAGSGLKKAPELPATTLATNCYFDMFYQSKLTSAPALPATVLAERCDYSMFASCQNLTTAPELPAAVLAPFCYASMFRLCIKLNYIKCLATDISADFATKEWVIGAGGLSETPSGTFVKAAGIAWPIGVDGIPEGWTIEEAGT